MIIRKSAEIYYSMVTNHYVTPLSQVTRLLGFNGSICDCFADIPNKEWCAHLCTQLR